MKQPIEPSKPFAPSKPQPPPKQITKFSSLGKKEIIVDGIASIKSFIEDLVGDMSKVDLDKTNISFSIESRKWYYDEHINELSASISSNDLIDDPDYEKKYKAHLEALDAYTLKYAAYKEKLKEYESKYAQYEIDRDKWNLINAQHQIEVLKNQIAILEKKNASN
jgi:hypothetical protein